MNHTNQLTELKLEIISGCPLHCLHCSSESCPERAGAVEPVLVRKLVQEFVSLGGSQIQLSGGEPLGHPALFAILDILRAENLAVSLYTSGVSAREGLCPIDAGQARDLRLYLRSAIFGLQGGCAEVHDGFTQVPGSFDVAMESLAACRAAGIDVAVHFVPTQQNYLSLPALISRVRVLGIRRVSLLRFVPHGRGAAQAQALALTPPQLVELRAMVEQLGADPKIHIRLGSPFRILQTADVPACHAAIDRMLVAPDGTAYPCDAFKGFPVDDPCRNVYSDGLERVWKESSFFRAVRAMGRLLPTECRGCPHEDTCHGGCPAQRAFEYRRLDKTHREPSCMAVPQLLHVSEAYAPAQVR